MNFNNTHTSNTFKLFYPLVAAVMAGLIIISCNTDETQTVTNFNKLTMQDEFSIAGDLDPNIWSFQTGNGEAEGIKSQQDGTQERRLLATNLRARK